MSVLFGGYYRESKWKKIQILTKRSGLRINSAFEWYIRLMIRRLVDLRGSFISVDKLSDRRLERFAIGGRFWVLPTLPFTVSLCHFRAEPTTSRITYSRKLSSTASAANLRLVIAHWFLINASPTLRLFPGPRTNSRVVRAARGNTSIFHLAKQ